MPVLTESFAGNTLQQWLTAVAVVIGSFAVLLVARRIIGSRLHKFARTTTTDIDDLFAEILRRTRAYLLLVLALYFGTLALSLPADWRTAMNSILSLTLLFQLGVWGTATVVFTIRKAFHQRFGERDGAAPASTALEFGGKLLVWSMVILLVLDNLGIDVTALVTGLGIGGVAVALALQNILGDLFASLSITLDKPFDIGDTINVDTMTGTVEHIGLKTTRVRSLSGEQIIFSNADLLRSRIRNYKRMEERRIVFSVGVTYQTPHDRLSRVGGIIREVIERQERTRFDRVHFSSFGESALLFETVYYVTEPDYKLYMDIQQRVNMELYKRFEEEGIAFAYPTRTLFVRSGTPSA